MALETPSYSTTTGGFARTPTSESGAAPMAPGAARAHVRQERASTEAEGHHVEIATDATVPPPQESAKGYVDLPLRLLPAPIAALGPAAACVALGLSSTAAAISGALTGGFVLLAGEIARGLALSVRWPAVGDDHDADRARPAPVAFVGAGALAAAAVWVQAPDLHRLVVAAAALVAGVFAGGTAEAIVAYWRHIGVEHAARRATRERALEARARLTHRGALVGLVAIAASAVLGAGCAPSADVYAHSDESDHRVHTRVLSVVIDPTTSVPDGDVVERRCDELRATLEAQLDRASRDRVRRLDVATYRTADDATGRGLVELSAWSHHSFARRAFSDDNGGGADAWVEQVMATCRQVTPPATSPVYHSLETALADVRSRCEALALDDIVCAEKRLIVISDFQETDEAELQAALESDDPFDPAELTSPPLVTDEVQLIGCGYGATRGDGDRVGRARRLWSHLAPGLVLQASCERAASGHAADTTSR